MLRVLYVDDESALLEVGKRFLERGGEFSVTIITSATAALPLLEQEQFDAVISDYQMPKMDGISFLKAVRGLGNDIPFILFTGKGREEIVIEAINNGADFYLQKGGDPTSQFAELSHKIRHAIRRRSAEKDLQESEERHRTIVNDLSELIVRFDPNGTITFSNTAHTSFMRNWRGVDGCTGKNFHDLVDDGKYATELGRDIALLIPDRPYLFKDVTEVWPDGTTHWYQWGLRAFFLPDGRVAEYQAVGHEITDLKINEDHLRAAYEQLAASDEELRSQFNELVANQEALKHSEEKFRDIVETSLDLIWEMDTAGTLTYMSPLCIETLGYSQEEIVGRTIFDLVPGDELPAFRETFSQGIRTRKQKNEFDLPLQCRDGHVIVVEIRSIPLLDPAGRFIGFRGTARDITSQRKAQKALAESEEKYRLLAEVTSDVIYMIDVQGTITYISPQISRYGYTPGGVVNRRFTDFIAEEYVEQVLAELQILLTAPGPVLTLFKIRGNDGNFSWMENNMAPVLDSSGAVVAVSGILRDVTERKKAEEAREETEKKFQALVENSLDGIIISDLTGNVLFMNQTAGRIIDTGDPDRLIGKRNVLEFLAPESRADALRDFGQVAQGIDSYLAQYKIITGKNQEVWVESIGRKILFGGTSATLVSIRDITKRKQDEVALQESEKKFSALFRSNPVPVTLVSAIEGKFIDVSDAFLRSTGYAREEVIDRTAEELGLFADMSEYGRLVSDLQKTHHVGGREIQCRTKRGEIRTCRFSSSIIQMGNKPHLLSTVEDITERKRADDTLKMVNKKLNLLSGITRHDIKNQLLVLDSFVELLREDVSGQSPTADQDLRGITDASRQIAAMIQFTKEYEQVGVHLPVWQDLRTLVDTAGESATPGGVTLRNEIPANTEVFADSLISKVMFNLIDNAVRHGGTITTIRFALETRDRDRVIVCEDDGNGVEPDIKERIFDMGYGKNTGFGLAISREILDITGITIRETGELGNGARFEVTVPADSWRTATT